MKKINTPTEITDIQFELENRRYRSAACALKGFVECSVEWNADLSEKTIALGNGIAEGFQKYGQEKEARETLGLMEKWSSEMIDQDENQAAPWRYLFQCYLSRHELDAARIALNKLASFDSAEQYQIGLIRFLTQRKEFDEAVRALLQLNVLSVDSGPLIRKAASEILPLVAEASKYDLFFTVLEFLGPFACSHEEMLLSLNLVGKKEYRSALESLQTAVCGNRGGDCTFPSQSDILRISLICKALVEFCTGSEHEGQTILLSIVDTDSPNVLRKILYEKSAESANRMGLSAYDGRDWSLALQYFRQAFAWTHKETYLQNMRIIEEAISDKR